MRFDILTIFPRILDSYVRESILKRARESGLVDIFFHNIRDYASDKHKTVDDTPYGGGPGMILKIEPLYNCLADVVGSDITEKRIQKMSNVKCQMSNDMKIILLSPQGEQFTQQKAEELVRYEKLILICGRYEGVDARVKYLVDEEISIGPYVLSGGELPAMVVTEAVARLVPGVLGSADSLLVESHGANKKDDGSASVSRHVVEYPQYTRPERFEPIPGVSWRVPEVLISGDHKKIDEWRRGAMEGKQG
ncbi:MAG: tRNA (guanosine(37)-N1)-methyltransferase TrmD [Candidatus Jacksonbacteria bacterium]|nr:tRNA (guanosine(37)-N1)-methyltransferase TrmD [Candidatus Jacksonbacteria bacterium]